MYPSFHFTFRFLPIACAAVLASTALAAPLNVDKSYLTTNTPFSVSNTDLLQTSLSSATLGGSAGLGYTGTVPLLYDGTFGAPGSDYDTSVAFEGGAEVTFNFNTTLSPQGYNISSISTFASWDSGRDGQEYTISYSLVGSPTTFNNVYTLPQFDPPGSGEYFSTRVSLSKPGGGDFLTGVAAIRFTFTDFENGGTAFREIDVMGSAVSAIPEPSTYAAIVGALALCGTIVYRRKTRAKTTA